MPIDLIPALAAFAFATSITPGPNNLMLMASGANYGFRRTVPHMLGVGIGFVVMVIAVGVGLAEVFEIWPITLTILQIVCLAFLLYLAWKIATARPFSPNAESAGRPMTFLAAAGFQWVNPKAWAMALTAITLYAPDRNVLSVLSVAAIFGLINIPSVGSWTFVGQTMARWLTDPGRARAFNVTMAVLLILSMYPMLA
ncbi:MAG: LysE family translocator [Pseudomonadota bacterium]